MKIKVVSFDSFAYVCPYFTAETGVNNGYGCSHKNQEETEEDETGVECGKCYCWSCPLGVEPDKKSLNNPDVDWDGISKEDCIDENGDILQGDYLMINVGANASEDEIRSLQSYEQYMNRHN